MHRGDITMYEIIIFGKTYKSILDMSKQLDLPYSKVRVLSSQGNKAIEEYIAVKVALNYYRVQYNSFTEACLSLRLNEFELRPYFLRGYTIEQLANLEHAKGLLPKSTPIKKDYLTKAKKSQHIEFRGVTYACIRDLCSAYKVATATYRSRIRLGWTIEQALGLVDRPGKRKVEPKKPLNRTLVTFRNREYSSFADLCRHYDAPIGRSRTRRKDGESLEDILINNKSKRTW